MMFGVTKFFIPYDPEYWFFQKAYYDFPHNSLSCCSETPAGFHYVKNAKEMYTMDYYTYQVHPFGIDKNCDEKLPRKLTLKEILDASDIASNSTLYIKHEFYHDIESSEVFWRNLFSILYAKNVLDTETHRNKHFYQKF